MTAELETTTHGAEARDTKARGASERIAKAQVTSAATEQRNAFIMLAIAIVAEVTATICLKVSQGFSVMPFNLITICGYVIAFAVLVKVMQYLPLGLTYGIWGGVGSAATMVAGIVIWNDPFTLATGLGLLLIIGGVYLLNKGTEEIELSRSQG